MSKAITTRQALRAIVTMHDVREIIQTPTTREDAEETALLVVRLLHLPLEWRAAAREPIAQISEPAIPVAHPLPNCAMKQIAEQVHNVRMAVSMRSPWAKLYTDMIACIRYYTTEEGDQP